MKAVDLRGVLHEVVPPNYDHPNVLSEMVVKQGGLSLEVSRAFTIDTALTYLVRGQWAGLSKTDRSPALRPRRVFFSIGMVYL